MNKETIKTIITNKKNILIAGIVTVVAGMLLQSFTAGNSASRFGGVIASESGSLAGFQAPAVGFSKQAVRAVSSDMAISDESYVTKPMYAGEGEYDSALERKLVKNGSISMVVRNMGQAREEIVLFVKQHGGFVASDNFSNHSYHDDYSNRRVERGTSGSLTLKVPGESFDSLFDQLRSVALVVNNEHTNTSDVTERYTDLETRLKNKQAEEEQYRQILKQAVKVSDILEVTRYIEQARNEAERIQGQLNVLSNQVDLATISVQLESEQELAVSGVSWDPGYQLQQAWRNLVQGSVDLADRLIAWVVYLPLLVVQFVLYAAIAYGVYTAMRWVYRKMPGKG